MRGPLSPAFSVIRAKDAFAYPSSAIVSGSPVVVGADAELSLEGRAEGEGAAVTDLVGDRADRGVGVLAQQVRREREAPPGEVGHRRFADRGGEPAGQCGA